MSDKSQGPGVQKEPGRSGRRRSWWRLAGLLVCGLSAITIVGAVVGIVLVRSRAETIGFDVANVATFALVLLAFLSAICVALILVLLQTHRSRMQRLLGVSSVVIGVCALVLALRFTIRVDGFDGRMRPVIRWRWEEGAGGLLEAPTVAEGVGEVDLSTSTPNDFPQFLGPARDLRLHDIPLERNWQATPPELVWERALGAGWSGFSVVNGYAVTLEQRGPDEVLTCYRVKDGQLMWAHANKARHETIMGGLGPRSTPTIDNGFVYALGATGTLQCVEGANGRLVWSEDLLERAGIESPQADLRAIAWGRSASPLVVDDLVIVPLGGPADGSCHSLAAFDKTNGELRWLAGDRQIGYASPSLTQLCGIEQVLIVNESSVSGHRLESGEVIWSYPWPGQSNAEANCSQAVVVPGDRVLLTNRRGAELIQLIPSGNDRLEADSIWLGRGKLKTKFTNVVVHDDYIYGLSDGLLECVELDSGRRVWKSRRGDYGHGQILAVDDLLLIQAETGEVVLVELNPAELVELGRLAALTELTWNTPCLYGSLLLVRNGSQAACYRLPLRDDKNAAGPVKEP